MLSQTGTETVSSKYIVHWMDFNFTEVFKQHFLVYSYVVITASAYDIWNYVKFKCIIWKINTSNIR